MDQRVLRGRSGSGAADVEVITEFRIRRDLLYDRRLRKLFAGAPPESSPTERSDAPDLVIILVEAKFFDRFGIAGLNGQLRSQRRQVRYLFADREQTSPYDPLPRWGIQAAR